MSWDERVYEELERKGDIALGDPNYSGGFEDGAQWQREQLLTDEVIERVARELAHLDDDDSWPTNIELGGNPFTGTRDDEYRHGMHEWAWEVLTAALGEDDDER